MGFNADCSQADSAAACALARKVVIPIIAYALDGSSQRGRTSLPALSVFDTPAADVPIKLLVQ